MKIENCSNEGVANKYENCFKGYCIELLDEIKKELKFNYTINEVTDGYGYMNANGNHEWNGMVRKLQDRVRSHVNFPKPRF